VGREGDHLEAGMNTRTRSNGAAAKVVGAMIGAGQAHTWQPGYAPAPAPTNDYPQPAVPETPVVLELYAMSGQLERLDQAIRHLSAKLDPVSMPAAGSSSDPSSPAHGGSPIVQQLAQRRSAIAAAAAQLEALAAQLEV
jgi:hypothetical protein